MDFARLMAKGSNYRFLSKKVPILDGDINNEVWSRMERVLGEDRNVLVNRSKHRVHLRLIKLEILDAGWIIRKDDKSHRMVFLPVDWEEEQVYRMDEFKEMDQEYTNEYKVRLYFNPKTHKVGCPGRPIVAWKPDYKGIAEVISTKEWFEGEIEKFPCDLKSVEEGVRKVKVWMSSRNSRLEIGDIKSMYPSIPWKELLSDLHETHVPTSVVDVVTRMVTGEEIAFHETKFKRVKGVSMGCPLSPVIARWFVQKRIHMVENMCIYVDDIALVTSTEASRHDEVQSRLPMEIEWDERQEFMDADFAEFWKNGGRTRFRDRGKVLGWQNYGALPDRMKKSIVRNEVKRIMRREEGPKLWMRHASSKGTGKVRTVQKSRGYAGPVRYLQAEHQGIEAECDLCTMIAMGNVGGKTEGVFSDDYILRSEAKVEAGVITVWMYWCEAFETREGRKVLRDVAGMIAKEVGWKVEWRWKLAGRKVMHALCWKTPFSRQSDGPEGTDENCSGFETG